MSITLNVKELYYSSDPVKVEAYRRAVELRELARERNGSSGFDRWESFVWTTPTPNGRLEVEEVTIDHESGYLTYSYKQVLPLSA